MIVNGSKESCESSKIYCCIECDYSTSRESQYIRHLSTRKHKMVVNGSNIPKKSQKIFLQMWKFFIFYI